MDACKASGISPTQANKAFATLPRFRALEADVARLRALRELMGDVRDGSETAVTLSQDDATRDFFVRAGKEEFYGQGFSGVLDQIIQANSLLCHQIWWDIHFEIWHNGVYQWGISVSFPMDLGDNKTAYPTQQDLQEISVMARLAGLFGCGYCFDY